MPLRRCPICDRPLDEADRPAPATAPFCSIRCRDVDLNRWFSEAYPVPIKSARVLDEALDALPMEDEDQ